MWRTEEEGEEEEVGVEENEGNLCLVLRWEQSYKQKAKGKRIQENIKRSDHIKI